MRNTATAAPLLTSLSARLLVLTVFFVMLSEVLIYAPSVARYRKTYLEDRIANGHLATLALEATPDNMVSEELEARLLDHVGAYVVRLRKADRTMLTLRRPDPPMAEETADLRQAGFFGLIAEGFETLIQGENRILRVIGVSPRDPGTLVDVLIDEAPMRRRMLDYSQRIMALSLFISLVTAALVYFSLQWLMVRPMRRLTASMIAFRTDPEDGANVVRPTARSDEIGIAQRELAMMQADLRATLWQKTRLAALGGVMTKINHDLRGILSSALVVSDRLEASADPEVRRVTPTLLKSIDRAVQLCSRTLLYAREGPPALERSRFPLAALVEEVRAESGAAGREGIVWRMDIPAGLAVEADREKLFRTLLNLVRNAAEAGASALDIAARQESGRTEVLVSDNGPGLSAKARENLFKPFAGSGRAEGTGLGLVIARDLMRAHGGDIELVASDGGGTVFRLILVEQRDIPASPLS